MKNIIVIAITIIFVLFIILVPIPTGTSKDGGTRTYTALTYKVVKWNRIWDESHKYTGTSVYLFPDNFKSIDELWNIEQKKIEK
ncbi:MAG: hypothetical protein J5582_03925 [Ruminococcus sp.]|uniref:hypothetical protein n=1 Tax=Ruminococcus sp. TaxID=41978 RepID=UPI0025E82D43|nr:hypothetical protein [Ruminococcus sp.]MBO4865704.1 hypothetical protein [Ruminococcus sp.]